MSCPRRTGDINIRVLFVGRTIIKLGVGLYTGVHADGFGTAARAVFLDAGDERFK